MPTLQAEFETSIPAREKRSVALSSLVAAALLTSLKILVGVMTGSLGILSEAAHSGLDLVAAGITFVAVQLADRPADSSHPFGHGKFEHLSAFVETALLLVTCAVIIFEAVRRLFFQEVHVEPSAAAYTVMLVSIVVDALRSSALARVARKYSSQALEADALHFSTDVYSSGVVILGLIAVHFSERSGRRWLAGADSVAALAVAAITVYISARLGRRTLDALVDAAPQGTSARIAEAISGVPGVLDYERIRVRQSGNRLFVDLGLTLESNIPFEHARAVVDAVESRVHEVFPDADVVVHAAPREPASSDTVERVRAIAHRDNFQVHDVAVYKVNGRLNVNLDLELDPGLRLDEAHARATTLESEIKRALGEVDEVNVHIEPLLKDVETGSEAATVRTDMERSLMRIARQTPGVLDCHSVEAHQVGPNVVVRLHCTLEPDLSVAQVHDITEDLGFKFRKAFPQISKVNIHPEPREK
ncbi:MAG TPA: cation-efflux pump [Terriglobia bacterium]|nr:cation-efflux pump [Terriglobia bacterium]